MDAMLRSASIFLLACLAVTDALAADAIIKRRATLRSDPSTQPPPIATLMPQEDVELIDNLPRSGYYHVRTSEGEEGWVYSRNIEMVQTVAVTGPAPVPIRRSRQPSADSGGVASSISPDWDKPEPNETTFNGPDGACGPTGDGGDGVTNRRKNRTDEPAQYHEVTWSAVQALPYPVAGRSLAEWTPEQLAQIQPFQGVPVSVVGYIAKIKIEDRGSGESTNCHFTNSDEVDWHIPLVEQQGDAESTGIVVETTPRVRQLHPNWTATALAPWVNSSSPVRIGGWTMLDPEHRAHLGKYRSTLWEVHPITRIEVFKDGQWADLDQVR
jgi:uncharacterized protein YraI